MQGITQEDDKPFLTIQFWLRSFLLLTNILSGMFCGMTCCMGKICLIAFARSPGYTFLYDRAFLITFLSCNITVYSNLYNLNCTIRLYSQLITMPTYECCIIFGLLVAGGLVMGEFDYYTNRQLAFICLGSCISVCGIMYKLCMLENSDLVKELKDDDGKVNDDFENVTEKKDKSF